MPPKVSVYMTVKNGLPYIKEAVESIRGQSADYWEAVIVDDGSSDGTTDFLNQLECDKRFTVVYTSGVGRGTALNIAVEKTRGKYIANIDADDVMHKDRLKIQYDFLESNKLHFSCSSSAIIFGSNNAVWEKFSKLSDVKSSVENEALVKKNPISHPSVMMEKGVFYAVGGYSNKRKSQLDYDLWIRLAEKGVALNKIHLPLVSKRIHANQSFENKKRLKYLLSSCMLQFRAVSLLKRNRIYYIYPALRFFYGLLPQSFRVSRIK